MNLSPFLSVSCFTLTLIVIFSLLHPHPVLPPFYLLPGFAHLRLIIDP